jgi:hypothetical protein
VDRRLGSSGAEDNAETPSAAGVSGDEVLRDVVRVASERLGQRLGAAYALGSLAHGGFSPLVSDVDVALILTDPTSDSDAEMLGEIADTVRALGSPVHSRVSIFWATPELLGGGAPGGRFPPLDRLCLFEHGRLLAGTDMRAGLPSPSGTELLVAGARFALDLLAEPVTGWASDPAGLLGAGLRRTTKLVLFPVRFLFTADTGREGTNDAAVQHYSSQNGPAAELVRAAFDWRTNPPHDQQATALLNDGFVALYRHYLDDHVDRLHSVGESQLAERFGQWRSRLPGPSADVPGERR